MPMRDYVCEECGYADEYIVGATVGYSVPDICPKCNKGKMESKFSLNSNMAFNFIGSGFYCNDYGKKHED